MIANEAGRNRPSAAPSSAAGGPSAATEDSPRSASTVSAATTAQRITSAASISVRGPVRSASQPQAGISTVRGTP